MEDKMEGSKSSATVIVVRLIAFFAIIAFVPGFVDDVIVREDPELDVLL